MKPPETPRRLCELTAGRGMFLHVSLANQISMEVFTRWTIWVQTMACMWLPHSGLESEDIATKRCGAEVYQGQWDKSRLRCSDLVYDVKADSTGSRELERLRGASGASRAQIEQSVRGSRDPWSSRMHKMHVVRTYRLSSLRSIQEARAEALSPLDEGLSGTTWILELM